MATITHPAVVDTRAVASAIQEWFESKGFETKSFQIGNNYLIQARKSGVVRAILAADRSIEVEVLHADGKTVVDVRQGSWKTNVVSNIAWLATTGGGWLAVSGWSVVIQKELESYIRSVLTKLGGVHEVDLKTDPPKLMKGNRSIRNFSIFNREAAPNKPQPADISFECYNCGQSIVVGSAGAGLQVNCPTCKADLIVPNDPSSYITPTPAPDIPPPCDANASASSLQPPPKNSSGVGRQGPPTIFILVAAAFIGLVFVVSRFFSSPAAPAETKIYVNAEEFGARWPLTVSGGFIIKKERTIPNASFKSYSVIFEAPDGTRYSLNGHARTEGYSDIHVITKYQLVFGDPIYEDVSELNSIGLNGKR